MKKRESPRRHYFTYPLSFILVSLLLLGFQGRALGLDDPKRPHFQLKKANRDILRGIDLLYNNQFDEAEDVFLKVTAESTETPEGYFYLAMVTWSRVASGFWGPEMVQEYKKRIDRTIQVAEQRIDHHRATSYDFFYLGGALGFKGRFELMRGNWLSSFFLARDAIDALETCLEMDPENRDVLLGLGTFDYYTAHLSGVLRFLTYLLVHKGDKEEGLRKLHIAAKKALYSGTEAKSTLLHIYLFLEQNFSKALDLAKDLATRYPRNPRHKVLEGVCYIRLGMDLQYRESVSWLRQKSWSASSLKQASIWKRRADYLETVRDLFDGRYFEARSKLRMILSHPDGENDPLMIAWPLIKIGMSYDLQGYREEATKYYRQVLNMKNGAGAQFLAKKLLDDPPKKDDPFIGF